MEPMLRNTEGASKPKPVSTKQQRIAMLAKQSPQMGFTSLAHNMDLVWLKEAYRRTRKDGAPGVDGMSGQEYEKNLESNLQSLLDRAQSGRYVAPPIRRVHIPKGNGGLRPLGIPTFEDKVLQRAVLMMLEPVYEQDFKNCSYGFRPGRSPHQALQTLWEGLASMGGGWVVDLDISQYFDTIDHEHLRQLLQRRVRDGVLLRLIVKWLKAGVIEEGRISHAGMGTPQGGAISPLLSNIYLHEVLDTWFEEAVKPRLCGEAFMVRFADDAVLVFAKQEDALKMRNVLPKRLTKFGLTLHPQKTELISFRKPAANPVGESGGKVHDEKRFDFLGFTHFWGLSRKGYWVVRRKTAKGRFSRSLKGIGDWCRENRHWDLQDQCRALSLKLKGHFSYYGITGNARSLEQFRARVLDLWRKWLSRRSRGILMTWARFMSLLQRYPLPRSRIVHVYSCRK